CCWFAGEAVNDHFNPWATVPRNLFLIQVLNDGLTLTFAVDLLFVFPEPVFHFQDAVFEQ
ncbi:hypothetical protein, partial [Endozoicomonas ascidiicola]|uniref:hypothetical protein n=1 Tax=Endozoicomonas ascidiicola TaxID=1698521 RepID=UPI001C12B987